MAKKILVIDDEPQIVVLLENRLKASGYECLTAGDGLTALDMAKQHKPNLIILDLMLPKMDGYKVCGFLKKDSRYAKIPIILFTARAQDADKRLAEEVGADAYIVKPFEPKVLLEKIQELLQTEPLSLKGH